MSRRIFGSVRVRGPLTVDGDVTARGVPVDFAGASAAVEEAAAAVAALTVAPVFAAPAFVNSWGSIGGGVQAAGYGVGADGVVIMRGGVSGGVGGTVAFTLPVGMRPSGLRVFLVNTDGYKVAPVAVASSGAVTVYLDSGCTYAMLEISFYP